MGSNWTFAALALGLSGSFGCTSGEDLELGRTKPAADSDAGDGSAQPADPDAGEDDSGEPPANRYRAQSCEAEISEELALEVFVPHIQDDSCAQPCELQLQEVQAAGDGSVWVRGRSQGNLSWIAHYSREGELLGSKYVPTDSSTGLMAVDDRGYGWLMTGDVNAAYSYLRRFDEGVNEIDMVPLAGRYTDLVRYPGSGVLVAEGLSPRVITALGYDGKPLWARVDAQPVGGRLGVDPAGRIAVASPVIAEGEQGRDTTSVVIDWLSERGGELRGTTNAISEYGGGAFTPFVNLIFDASSRLTLVGSSPAPALQESYFPQLEVERIDPEHGTRWYWRTRGAGENAADVDPVSGSVVLAESGIAAAFTAIAADGRSCRRFSIAEKLMVADVATGPDGEIWFVSGMFPEGGDKWDNQLGRLERPDL